MPARKSLFGAVADADPKGAAFIGLLLGLGAFWNGALVISALLILGTAILWSRARVGLLICCGIATSLAMLEARFFIHGGPAVVPRPHFGFLAFPTTASGVITYYLLLLGLTVPLLAIAFWMLSSAGRWLLVSILVPIVFATTFTFTADVSVNHKFVNVSVRLAAIFVAVVVVRLFDTGRIARLTAVALCLALTATGIIDFTALWNSNREKRTHDLANPMLAWVAQNTDPHAVIAAPPVYHHLVYLTGRLSYLGLPYWAESAGYDVPRRKALLARVYEGSDTAEIGRISKAEHIAYLIVDDTARVYFPKMREDVLRSGFPVVFSEGRTQIYALPHQ